MTDVFGEWVPFELLDRLFAVFALRPDVTFQVLTKRPERMAEYLNTLLNRAAMTPAFGRRNVPYEPAGRICAFLANAGGHPYIDQAWPLPNVWLGTSVENQETADERVAHLLKCPAAVRFLSCEPLLGPIDLRRHLAAALYRQVQRLYLCDESRVPAQLQYKGPPSPDWVIVGGESGPGARPMEYDWARAIISQCLAADVPCFYKQGGSAHACEHSAKGGCLDCAPADLRVRQWPRSNHGGTESTEGAREAVTS